MCEMRKRSHHVTGKGNACKEEFESLGRDSRYFQLYLYQNVFFCVNVYLQLASFVERRVQQRQQHLQDAKRHQSVEIERRVDNGSRTAMDSSKG